jgi:hypothetical protein
MRASLYFLDGSPGTPLIVGYFWDTTWRPLVGDLCVRIWAPSASSFVFRDPDLHTIETSGNYGLNTLRLFAWTSSSVQHSRTNMTAEEAYRLVVDTPADEPIVFGSESSRPSQRRIRPGSSGRFCVPPGEMLYLPAGWIMVPWLSQVSSTGVVYFSAPWTKEPVSS